MNRRQFLHGALALATTGSLGLPSLPVSASLSADALVQSFDLSQGRRTLDLYRSDTGERTGVGARGGLLYLDHGVWVPGAYEQICWLLRDVQAGQAVRMDARLIAALDWVQRFLASYGYVEPIHVLSGFRSQATNNKIEGAAKNSQHLYGKAVDIRLPGLSAEYLSKLFSWLSQGGVGVYASRDFVHIDTGTIRHWVGR